MSDTPRTDAAEFPPSASASAIARVVEADFVRTLERELAAVTAENAALRANSAEATELLREIRDGEVNAEDEADKFIRDGLPSKLSEVTAERDAALRKLAVAREALQRIANYYSSAGYIGGMAEDALKSTKPSRLGDRYDPYNTA